MACGLKFRARMATELLGGVLESVPHLARFSSEASMALAGTVLLLIAALVRRLA
jgi:hypothetical protein